MSRSHRFPRSSCPRRRVVALLAILCALLVPLTANDLGETGSQIASAAPPNVIVIVLDDAGLDKVVLRDALGGVMYGVPPITGGAWNHSTGVVETPASLPNLSLLAQQGVRFNHAYSAPLCSPSRALILSGRHAYTTGMLALSESRSVSGAPSYALPYDDYELLPQMLKTASNYAGTDPGYTCGAFGKWHLAGEAWNTCHPTRCGFDTVSVHMQNLANHFQWSCVDNVGATCAPTVPTPTTVYDAEMTRRRARGFIDAAVQAGRPFFAYVAFHPPHVPFQLPPTAMVSKQTRGDVEKVNGWAPGTYRLHEKETAIAPAACSTATDVHFKARLYYKAMLESVDHQIGLLLGTSGSSVTDLDNTVVLVVGDNGTANEVVQTRGHGVAATGLPYAANHSKRSLYEHGVRVPLLAFGPGVDANGLDSDALVSLDDFWATIAEIAGATPPLPSGSDSTSFLYWLANPDGPPPSTPYRRSVYVETGNYNGFTIAPNGIWNAPGAPSAVTMVPAATYSRATITDSGLKYIRQCPPDGAVTAQNCTIGAPMTESSCVGFTTGCGATGGCGGPNTSEEYYKVFGVGCVDTNEVQGICSSTGPCMAVSELEIREMRCIITSHSEN